MIDTLYNFLLDSLNQISLFGTWLTTKIDENLFPYTPLGLFSVGVIVILIGYKLVRLIIGG